MSRITLRIDLEGIGSIGPGKVRLLELIREQGSIRRAGATLGMSYSRAWGLVRELADMFGADVVAASPGGKSGGGATLTDLGIKVVKAYRSAELKAKAAARPDVERLRREARPRKR